VLTLDQTLEVSETSRVGRVLAMQLAVLLVHTLEVSETSRLGRVLAMQLAVLLVLDMEEAKEVSEVFFNRAMGLILVKKLERPHIILMAFLMVVQVQSLQT